jgi:uncharacterized protein DUF4386
VESSTTGDKRVLQWGGIAGIIAGILFVVEAIVISSFVPPGLYLRFPDVTPGVALGAAIELFATILWVILLVALYRALRSENPAPALFGSVLGVMGWTVFLVGTGQTPVFTLISETYRAPGTTAAGQAALALIWPVARSIFNEIETTGGLIFVIGIVLLGAAMFKTPAFGRGLGGLCAVIGISAVIGTLVFAYSSLGYTLLVLPAVIVLPFVLGWKVLSLSRKG